MTTPIANVDNTTLNNLTPNLDTNDVADPALRKLAFQYIYAEMQTIITAYNAFIAAGAVATGNLADLSVTTAKLADLAVTTGKIPDLAIVTAKINDLAVTAAKIALGTITSAQIADLSIATGDLADALITTAKLADLNVTTAKYADASVTLAKMATASVGTSQLVDGSVTDAKIAPATITADKFVAGALNNDTQNGLNIVALQADVVQRAINVKSAPYNAKGDGITDDSAAIRSAIRAAVNASSLNGNMSVYFPPGVYLLSSSGVFSDITQTSRGGIHFIGAGRMATVLQLTTAGSAKWFYDNGVNSRFQFCTFSHMQFTADSTVNGNGFKPYSSGHEQGFHFYDCWFTNLATGFRFDGTAGNSEYKFFGCKFYGITSRCFDLNNAQSVNLELNSTECENIYGDVFYINTGGGGSIKTYGGSFILGGDGSVTDKYILHVNETNANAIGNGNCDFTFVGMKTELNDVYSKLVKYINNEGLGLISFIGCNMSSNLGGSRELVYIGPAKEVHFDKCFLTSTYTFRITGGNPAYGHAGRIDFNSCKLSTDFCDKITFVNGYGTFSARNCVDNAVTPGAAFAINFDRNWQNQVLTDAGVPLKTVVIKPALANFPYASGTEYSITLPTSAIIKNIYIYKPAVGGSGSSYQLFVGSDDKLTIYGSSTLTQQKFAATITVTNLMLDVSTTARVVRLWATGGDSQHPGGYAIIEYY